MTKQEPNKKHKKKLTKPTVTPTGCSPPVRTAHMSVHITEYCQLSLLLKCNHSFSLPLSLGALSSVVGDHGFPHLRVFCTSDFD